MNNEVREESSAAARAEPASIALALNGASREEADAFLRMQRRLTDLQIEDIDRENRLRHWTLRLGNISAVMKVTFEIALAIVMLAIVGLIGLAIWTAARDDGLVIEAFNVPQDLAAKGLTGRVVATQVQDRIAFIQSHADTLRAASTFRNNWGDDIKVQIPDTGVSIDEAYRFLAQWLGHETRITGELWRDGGGIALSARAGSAPAKVFRGPESDLDALVTKAAEYVYWQTQPYRYTVFLGQQGRTEEALAYTKQLAVSGPAEDRAWAYSRWGWSFELAGNLRGTIEKNRVATTLDPLLPHPLGNIAGAELGLGHDEAALRDVQHAMALLRNGGSRQFAEGQAKTLLLDYAILAAEEKGAFASAIASEAESEKAADLNAANRSATLMMSNDLARNHDISRSVKAEPAAPNEEALVFAMMATEEFAWYVPPLPQAMRAATLDDWRGVRNDLLAVTALPAAHHPHVKAYIPATIWPWLAYAYARTGDLGAAYAQIG